MSGPKTKLMTRLPATEKTVSGGKLVAYGVPYFTAKAEKVQLGSSARDAKAQIGFGSSVPAADTFDMEASARDTLKRFPKLMARLAE